jgi:RNA polymerase sigma factor (sigma-70 family)
MTSAALADGLRHLRNTIASQCHRDDSDEQLLRAFTVQREEAAFAVLVRRHGPMVLHLCRCVLGHEQDAEDAFQATFLVLARNAAALRKKSSLASFLHGTAYRLSPSAKRAAARRRKHEGQLGALAHPRSPAEPVDELSWREVRTLLDEEIDRLPEIYRSVFVLCYLEGLSRTIKAALAAEEGVAGAVAASVTGLARRRSCAGNASYSSASRASASDR